MEEWKLKPVVINFESLFSQTMWFESFEATYKDGQANLHITFNFVEFNPVKIVSYSNTKQLLKPGVIITKSSKSRPNTTGKTDKKNKTKKSEKSKKAEEKRRKMKRRNPLLTPKAILIIWLKRNEFWTRTLVLNKGRD